MSARLYQQNGRQKNRQRTENGTRNHELDDDQLRAGRVVVGVKLDSLRFRQRTYESVSHRVVTRNGLNARTARRTRLLNGGEDALLARLYLCWEDHEASVADTFFYLRPVHQHHAEMHAATTTRAEFPITARATETTATTGLTRSSIFDQQQQHQKIPE